MEMKKHSDYESIRRKRESRRETDRHGVEGRREPSRGMWWWVSAVVRSKRTGVLKPCLLGPYNSEEAAWEKGYQHCENDFDVVSFQTRDVRHANQLNRVRLLDKERTLESVLERVRHKGEDIGI